MFEGNAHAIILHGKDMHASLRICAAAPELDLRLCLIAHEFGSVVEQVLQNLRQARTVPMHHRKMGLDGNSDPARHNPSLDKLCSFAHQVLEWKICGFVLEAADA